MLAVIVMLSAPGWAKTQTGRASYYGAAHEGRLMANGAPFHAAAMTAASRTWPLGTRVRVCTHRPRCCITVTITDRGPYHKGRILDLSFAAARALGFIARGTAIVTITEEQEAAHDRR